MEQAKQRGRFTDSTHTQNRNQRSCYIILNSLIFTRHAFYFVEPNLIIIHSRKKVKISK